MGQQDGDVISDTEADDIKSPTSVNGTVANSEDFIKNSTVTPGEWLQLFYICAICE